MDLGALFIGGSLLFASGVVLASVIAAIEIGRLKADNNDVIEANAELLAELTAAESQLEATQIALRDAQANDHRDARGRFVKAT